MSYLIKCSVPTCSNTFILSRGHDIPQHDGLVCADCYEEAFLKALDALNEKKNEAFKSEGSNKPTKR